MDAESNTGEAGESHLSDVGRWICIALAVIPFAALCFKVWQYGLCFPYWDAWAFAPLLEKSAAGTMSFGDFWAQHNEHRVVVPRLVMYALARMSGWNVAWEIADSLVLGVAIFLLCCRLAFRGRPWRTGPWWLVPLFSLLVFSWVQMENWVWGWEINTFLNTAGVLASAALLTSPRLSPARFAMALAAALAASFSFANGLFVWIALAPLVLLASGIAWESCIIYSLLWVAAGILVIQLYLISYTKPGVSPSLGSLFQAPLPFLGYVALYIGAPVTGMFTQPAWHGFAPPVGPAHYIAGALGLLAVPVLLARILRRNRQDYVALLPWMGLVLYVFGSALITAAGRSGFGLEQAMTSRYMTMSSLYWYGLAGIVLVYLQGRAEPLFATCRARRLAGTLGAVCILALLFLSHQSQRAWEQNARWKQMGWTALRAGHLAPLYLQDLCWDPVELRDRFLPILREGQWAGFDGEAYRPVEKADDYVDEAERFMEMGLRGQAKTYLETALLLDENHEGARKRYQELRESMEGTP